jgi:hypothetical protein
MEVSLTYGITNLIIMSIWLIGFVFAISFLLKAHTRTFGVLFTATLLLVTYLHGVALRYITFHTVDIDPSGLLLVVAVLTTLTVRAQHKLKANKIPLFGRDFIARFVYAFLIVVLFLTAASILKSALGLSL